MTHVVLPYRLPTTNPENYRVIVAPGGTRTEGQVIQNFTLSEANGFTVVSLPGNWEGQPFYMGLPYVFHYEFSTLAVREDAPGGGQNVVGEGRLQLRRMSLLYDKTSYFRVEVTPKNRDTYRYVFSGRVVGSAENKVGDVPVERGKFRFALMGRNDQMSIKIINDTHLPCHFLSGEWEGYFILRSKRI